MENFNEVLVMPNKFTKLEESEMMYLNGGSISIGNSAKYLNRGFCSEMANFLLMRGLVEEMSQLDIAKEIFAHSVCFYASNIVNKVGIDNSVTQYLQERGAIIDITDGGDTFVRKATYNAIWYSAL